MSGSASGCFHRPTTKLWCGFRMQSRTGFSRIWFRHQNWRWCGHQCSLTHILFINIKYLFFCFEKRFLSKAAIINLLRFKYISLSECNRYSIARITHITYHLLGGANETHTESSATLWYAVIIIQFGGMAHVRADEDTNLQRHSMPGNAIQWKLIKWSFVMSSAGMNKKKIKISYFLSFNFNIFGAKF